MKKTKAQIFSVDLIFSLITFTIILILSATIWDYSTNNFYVSEKRNDLELISKNIMSTLLYTEGNPSNWSDYDFNSTNILSLGLIKRNDGNNILDITKIGALSSSNETKYNDTKIILGILGPNYEFSIAFYEQSDTDYTLYEKIGRDPQQSAINAIVTERFALNNKSRNKITLKLWEK